MFGRFISIDWSGAASDGDRVAISIAEALSHQHGSILYPPNARSNVKHWTRKEVVGFLANVLRPGNPLALLAMDFGFGLPWGADRAIFNCSGWRAMLDSFARLYRLHGTAVATAEAINSDIRFNSHGPYRFNETRTDYHFYLHHNVAYYRSIEVMLPQAISQWYFGAGPKVASHTITGLASLAELLRRRDEGELSFVVWPQEGLAPLSDKHVLVESYPSIYPEPEDYGPCREHDKNERDAWRVIACLVRATQMGSVENLFAIPSRPFGRIAGLSFEDQVQFEGWIVGVSEGS